jgi:hypothetical protein
MELFMRSLSVVFITAFALLLSACGGEGSGGDSGEGGGSDISRFTITSISGDGGNILPASVTVDRDETASFTLTPEADYIIGTVIGCDGSLEGDIYSTGIVTQDCAVSASFKQIYAVTASAELGGIIFPAEKTVIHGETTSFTLTPEADYVIDSVTGCNGSLEGNTYSTAIVTEDCEVSASFNQPPSANAGTAQTVIANSTVTLDGSTSTDLEDDASAPPTPLHYSWQQTDATDIIVTLNDINLATPSFEAPSVTATTVLQFTLTVTDDNEDRSTDDVSITVNVKGKLNDTGITKCLSYRNIVSCTGTGKDGEYGRDARSSKLIKVGAGRAGFDFTKLDASGKALDDQALTGSCVQDNHTGLVWEVKTTSGLHNKDDTYTWYNTDSSTHKKGSSTNGNTCDKYNRNVAKSFCNTQAFVARVNNQGLCGTKNWRLPNKNELSSIVDFATANPAIDSDYFLNTLNNCYWSSSQVAIQNNRAWIVCFDKGGDGGGRRSDPSQDGSKGYDEYVRLVRGGK